MKKSASIVPVLVACFFFYTALGQNKATRPVSHFNNFQKFIKEYQKDSALMAANELAKENAGTLHMLLHDSFAQSFMMPARSQKDSVYAYELLTLLSQSDNLTVANSVQPLALWVKAKQASGATEFKKILNGFMELNVGLPRRQTDRTERYALLIYQMAQQYPLCTTTADSLLDQVSVRLENLVKNDFYSPADRNINTQRAYFRFLFASTNYLRGLHFKKVGDNAKAEPFFQTASEWSPDESDRNRKTGYFYESFFLFGDADDDIFRKPYIDFLIDKGRKTEATQLLVEMAKADPYHIGTLKEYYEKQQMGQQPFTEYWREILNADKKEAFPFKLTLLNGAAFDVSQHKGKWVLIDFWGTWCVPCVEELPTMQKFYEGIKAQNDIVLVTIACSDTETKVRNFMQKNAYSFPVVMSDGNVEKRYPVDGYPTKILITPQGKRIRIEFGVDWVSRVNTYRKY
jgi:thiol-disulfide isomerase/thioredoxin